MTAPADLNIRIAGADEPALLFVHGFGCSLDDWGSQIDALSPSYRCIALDLPGHGGSPPPGAATIAALGEAVNVAKRCSGARAVVLVGHSLGTKVVREAYRNSPDGVVGVAMIDGRFYEGDREQVVGRARAAIDCEGFHGFVRRHFGELALDTSPPSLRERVIASALRLDASFGRDLYLDALAWDLDRGVESLRRLVVPTLMLQTTHVGTDGKRRSIRPGMTTAFMDAAARLVAQAGIRIIPGSGHFPMIETPEALTRELRRFVDELTTPTTTASATRSRHPARGTPAS